MCAFYNCARFSNENSTKVEVGFLIIKGKTVLEVLVAAEISILVIFKNKLSKMSFNKIS